MARYHPATERVCCSSVVGLVRTRAADFSLPKRSDLDAKLILGAAIFGAGWGLGGFCPGPALTSLASNALPVFIFVVAMGIGMYLHTWGSECHWTGWN